MDITPPVGRDVFLVQSFGPEGVTVAGVLHSGSVAVFQDGVTACAFSGLQDIDADFLTGRGVELLLIGTPEGAQALPPSLRKALAEKGIKGVEVMTGAAACRTYNVLAAEGRKVALVLDIRVSAP